MPDPVIAPDIESRTLRFVASALASVAAKLRSDADYLDGSPRPHPNRRRGAPRRRGSPKWRSPRPGTVADERARAWRILEACIRGESVPADEWRRIDAIIRAEIPEPVPEGASSDGASG